MPGADLLAGNSPLIVLTTETPLKLTLPGATAVLPFRDAAQVVVLFQLIERLTGAPSPLSLSLLLQAQHRLHEHVGEGLAAEQAWLDQRRVWLEQRHEWLEEQLSWIDLRYEWLDQRRTEPNSQHEWWEEQDALLKQREDEVHLQRTQLIDLERWLSRSQQELDQLWQRQLRKAQ